MEETVKKRYPLIVAGLLLGFLWLFFAYIHPVYVFNQDDWQYIAHYRRPFPLWHGWNPSRVLPEIFMPLVGYLAAYLVKPILADYVLAVTVTCAFVIGLAITVYYLAFQNFVKNTLQFSTGWSVLLGLFFILTHFGLFRSLTGPVNTYLFYSWDLTCYFFYIIPCLMNGVVVLSALSYENFADAFSEALPVEKGLWLLLLFLCIFSNIFASVMLAAFAFFCLVKEVANRTGKYKVYGNIVVAWLISAIFTCSGNNAKHISQAGGQNHFNFLGAIKCFGGLLKQIDWSYIILGVVCLLGVLLTYKKHRKLDGVSLYKNKGIICMGTGVLTTIALLLISAVSVAGYAGRAESMFGSFFYGIILMFLAGMFLLKITPKAQYVFPLFMMMFLIIGTNSFSAFKESNSYGLAPWQCMAVSRNFIQQAQAADREGKTQMTLYVPKGVSSYNWPHPVADFGKFFGHTLYAHKLIDRPIIIKVKIDANMNKQFYKQDVVLNKKMR